MSTLSISQTLQLASQAGFTGKSLQTMVSICICESGLRTDAIGPVGEVGIGQIYLVVHPTVSRTCAFDPLCNLRACYTISSGGTNFNPWTTFRNGCYLGHMSEVGAQMATVTGVTGAAKPQAIPHWCQPFMAQSQAWWEANGHHYPKDWNAAEGGVDWNPSPLNDTITALLPGVIVGSGYFCKPGHFCNLTWQECNGIQGYGVVTIRSANPYPDLVPGSQIDIYYQHIKIDSSIGLTCAGKRGQAVNAGQVIGTGNGVYNIEVGVNVGTEWGQIWGGTSPGPHVDPIPFLYRLLSNGVPTGGGLPVAVPAGGMAAMYSGLMDTITTTSSQAKDFINNVPGFLGICESLDIVEQFIPFTLPGQALQDISTASQPGTYNLYGWDTGIPNIPALNAKAQATIQLPSDAMQAVLVFVVTNMTAFLIRSMFVVAGLILFYALMINLGIEILDVKDTAQTVEQVAPLFM